MAEAETLQYIEHTYFWKYFMQLLIDSLASLNYLAENTSQYINHSMFKE